MATIIVLCWNKWHLTKRCLETIKDNTDLSKADVLVVNNGSSDETQEELKKIDWINSLNLTSNLGFVRGNNAGIESVSGDVILLNNDVEITDNQWVEKLTKTAYSREDIGVVGCRLILPDGRLLHTGTYILPDTFWGQQIGSLEKDINQFNFDKEVQGIVFACAYIKRDLIDKVGGLSLDYESYFEDTDYCLKAKENGYKTMLCGNLTLTHKEHGSSSNPNAFNTLFQGSREKFINKWRHKLSQYSSNLSWQSIMNFPSGYAMSCREILKALENENVRVNYEYVYGIGTPFPTLENNNSEDYRLDIIKSRKESNPLISVVYGQGDVFIRNNGKYKIGYTMLEVDGFPSEWVRQSNTMDEIWTPSEFNRQGLIKSGVKKPIYVMPLGVNTEYFNSNIRENDEDFTFRDIEWNEIKRKIRHNDEDYQFLSVFEFGERKNSEFLLSNFNKTFKSSDKAVLICKVDANLDMKSLIRKMNLSKNGGRILFLHNTLIPSYQLGTLYTSADCYISVSHGEGWDMPLMEAMACGLPSIATDWGAHTQFIHSGISYPLKIKGLAQPKENHPYYNGFHWANPDENHFIELLKNIFHNQSEAKKIGKSAEFEMKEFWGWHHLARRIETRIGKIRQDI